MDNEDLDQILRTIDSPGEVPSEFRSELLQDLREAFDAPGAGEFRPIIGDDVDAHAETIHDFPITILPLDGVSETRSIGPKVLVVAAAVTLVIIGLLLASPNNSELLEVTDDPAVVTTTVLPPLSIQDACSEFLGSTTALSEIAALEEPELVSAELNTWRDGLDRLLDRSPAELTTEHVASISRTRVLVRQALNITTPSTIVAIEEHWRDITAGLPLSHCRR